MNVPDLALRDSQRYCDRLARKAAGNFYYGFMLLPRAQKQAMCALYAFLRHSDDIVDDDDAPGEKQARLDDWRRRLEAALADEPAQAYHSSPILPALVAAVQRFQIPSRHLHDALDGVGMDLFHRTYQTFDDLRAYCYRVASTVGLCCLHIWGFDRRDGQAEQMAEACGLAFQLTNIVRDVREDARRGRVYLPMEDLDHFGVRPDTFDSPHPDPRVRELLAFECARAEEFYRQASPLEFRIEPGGRPMLRAIVGIYQGLLHAIRSSGYDVFARRIRLSPLKKTAIALRALGGGRR